MQGRQVIPYFTGIYSDEGRTEMREGRPYFTVPNNARKEGDTFGI